MATLSVDLHETAYIASQWWLISPCIIILMALMLIKQLFIEKAIIYFWLLK